MLRGQDGGQHRRHAEVDVLPPAPQPVTLALLVQQVAGDAAVIVRRRVHRGQTVAREKPHLGRRVEGVRLRDADGRGGQGRTWKPPNAAQQYQIRQCAIHIQEVMDAAIWMGAIMTE